MNTNRSLQFLLLLTAVVFSRNVGNATETATEPVRVFIVDDQTGEELRTKHGIQPLQVDDLIVLVNSVLLGNTPVRIDHQAVDEDVTDNGVAQMVFKPFSGGPAPTAPRPNMPLRQFAELANQFQADRSKWQREIAAYRRDIDLSAEAFVKRVAETQFEVAQRFDRILKARNGRDFNRSDIVGSVMVANSVLGNSGRRVLILNTDAQDLPGKRAPRRTPLTATEIDPGIFLVFVNTSRIPEQSILFAKVTNPVHHADSVKEAMEFVAGLLKSPEEAKAKNSTASR